MNVRKQVFFWLSVSFFALFVLWTILVKVVDVETIYNGTKLGFYHLNYKFGDLVTEFGKYEFMRVVSDILLYISLGYTLILVVVALIQLIKYKSLKKVNPIFYFLAGAYLLIAILYVFFELVHINYSPDSVAGSLKASYPSTHVFVGGSLFLLNSYVLLKFLWVKDDLFKTLIHLSTVVLTCLIVLTRLLAVKHWLTDIIGAVILTCSVYFLFIGMCRWLIPTEVKDEYIELKEEE